MTHELSILIPTYNYCCLTLVTTLAHQAEEIDSFCYEIIVADDGSTDEASIHANMAINAIGNCRYVKRRKNTGRSAIRNFLARSARYPKLLFIDSDMTVARQDYLKQFLCAKGDVVYGGYHTEGSQATLASNLRFRYEQAAEKTRAVRHRQAHPYHTFRTCNFMISRNVMLRHPFDERFARYGFEDTLFAKTLCQADIHIQHINNPLCFDTFESNAVFMEKTEEGLRTLHTFSQELEGFSSLLAIAHKLDRWHLSTIIRGVHRVAGKFTRNRLTEATPPLWVFNAYKLGYFMSMQRHP